MAAGSHFGFWALLGVANTFARGIEAHFSFKYLKVFESTLKPSSALGGHRRSIYDPTTNTINSITLDYKFADLFNLEHDEICSVQIFGSGGIEKSHLCK